MRMNRRTGIIVLAAALCGSFAGVANAQEADVSKMALITIEASIEIDTPMERAWAALTETDLAHSWYPGWKNAGGSTSLNKVGNTIRYNDGYGNSGLSVVLYVDPGTELRVAHVPDNGSYLCQAKFRLVQRPGKTVVKVTEQYSDDLSVPTDKDTAEMTRREIVSYLAALKTLAEGNAPEEPSSSAPALLDGSVFTGEIGEHNKHAFAPEELTFENGHFRSTHSDKYQFGFAPYTAIKREHSVAFEADALSPTDGRMKWKGTVTGATIDATVDWYDKSGKLIKTYWVKGKLKGD